MPAEDPQIVQRFTAWLAARRPQWLAAVPHASALVAEAWCLSRDQPEALQWLKMRSTVQDALRQVCRRQRLAPRGSQPGLPDAVAAPGEALEPLLARDQVEALLVARGTTQLGAEALAAWLAGEPLKASAQRLGLTEPAVSRRRDRARRAVGLTVVEVQALVSRMRGVPLAEAAYGGRRPARGGNASTIRWRRWRGCKPVDPSTVSLRIKSALEKLRA